MSDLQIIQAQQTNMMTHLINKDSSTNKLHLFLNGLSRANSFELQRSEIFSLKKKAVSSQTYLQQTTTIISQGSLPSKVKQQLNKSHFCPHDDNRRNVPFRKGKTQFVLNNHKLTQQEIGNDINDDSGPTDKINNNKCQEERVTLKQMRQFDKCRVKQAMKIFRDKLIQLQ